MENRVLLINLGTPDSTNWFDIRKYLKEFLSDRRVIEVNPIIWQIILNPLFSLGPPKQLEHIKKFDEKREYVTITILYKNKWRKLEYFKGENLIIDFARDMEIQVLKVK